MKIYCIETLPIQTILQQEISNSVFLLVSTKTKQCVMLCYVHAFYFRGQVTSVVFFPAETKQCVCGVTLCYCVCGFVSFYPQDDDVSAVCQWQNWMLLFFLKAAVVFASGKTGCCFSSPKAAVVFASGGTGCCCFSPKAAVVFASGRTGCCCFSRRLQWCLPVAELDVCYCHVIGDACFYFPSDVCSWR